MKQSLFLQSLVVVMILCMTMDSAFADGLKVKSRAQFPPAQLGVSPPRFEEVIMVSQGQRLDTSLVLYNFGAKPKSIKLALLDVDKDKKVIRPNKNTLLPWTIINPKSFVISAQGKQTIRLSIRPPLSFLKEKHYAFLKIEQQIDNAVTVDEETKSAVVKLGSSYALPIIVTAK